MSGYYKPFGPEIPRGQRFGDNPNWGPNPAGGHNGDDYKSPVGTPVYAAGNGVVVYAGRFDSTYADNWGWNLNFGGQMVVLNLDGADGPYVEYGHNSELRVNTGDRVTAGQVIALSGEDDGGTHVITGPHLHVGCLPPNFDLGTNTYGRVNPDIYLTDYWGGTISAQSSTITPLQEALVTPEQMATLVAEIRAQGTVTQQIADASRTHVQGLIDALNGNLVINRQQAEDIVAAVTARVPNATLNAQFKLADGTVTNLAGILAAINAKPAMGNVINQAADPAAVVSAIKAQWNK